MPEWFRPASAWNSFDGHSHTNSFVFAIYNSEWGREYTENEILAAFESFPEIHAQYILGLEVKEVKEYE